MSCTKNAAASAINRSNLEPLVLSRLVLSRLVLVLIVVIVLLGAPGGLVI